MFFPAMGFFPAMTLEPMRDPPKCERCDQSVNDDGRTTTLPTRTPHDCPHGVPCAPLHPAGVETKLPACQRCRILYEFRGMQSDDDRAFVFGELLSFWCESCGKRHGGRWCHCLEER